MISHEDDERVDVLVPLLVDVLDARIFYHRGHHIMLDPIIPDLKCVLKSRVRRETWGCHARESVCDPRLVRPGGSDGMHDFL